MDADFLFDDFLIGEVSWVPKGSIPQMVCETVLLELF